MKFLCIISLLFANTLFAQSSQKVLRNPVLNIDFPDPTVIMANGKYYAYATQANHDGKMQNIQLAVSDNLQDWNYIGDVLPQKPLWASHTQDFWAPHVLYDPGLHQYVLFFSAKANDTTFDKCIGVAFANKPEGPFIAEKTPLITGKGFESIDPMAIIDPKSKKKYLFWGSGFQPLHVEAMNNNWKSFVKDSHKINVVYPKTEKKYTVLIEGSWVDYSNGYYYLYYSGDNCCGNGANYAVMVAKAKNITGPYVRLAKAKHITTSAILEKDTGMIAPGHNSVITDADGNKWIAYHAIVKQADSGFDRSKRVFYISPLVYKNGWPKVIK